MRGTRRGALSDCILASAAHNNDLVESWGFVQVAPKVDRHRHLTEQLTVGPRQGRKVIILLLLCYHRCHSHGHHITVNCLCISIS